MTICRLYFSLTPARDIVEVELNYDIYCSTTRFSYYPMFISVPQRQSQKTRQRPFLAFLTWHNVLSKGVCIPRHLPPHLSCRVHLGVLYDWSPAAKSKLSIVPFLTDFLFILTTSITRSVLKFWISTASITGLIFQKAGNASITQLMLCTFMGITNSTYESFHQVFLKIYHAPTKVIILRYAYVYVYVCE